MVPQYVSLHNIHYNSNIRVHAESSQHSQHVHALLSPVIMEEEGEEEEEAPGSPELRPPLQAHVAAAFSAPEQWSGRVQWRQPTPPTVIVSRADVPPTIRSSISRLSDEMSAHNICEAAARPGGWRGRRRPCVRTVLAARLLSPDAGLLHIRV